MVNIIKVSRETGLKWLAVDVYTCCSTLNAFTMPDSKLTKYPKPASINEKWSSLAACITLQDVPKEHQMVVAIVLILWVSAVASSFIDNIPFTTATIPVIWELASSPDLCVTLRPLVWALAFGACLGGER